MNMIAEEPAPQATKKREGVTGKMFYLDDELLEAVQAFFAAQEIKSTQTAFFETAIKAYLKSKGYWPLPKT